MRAPADCYAAAIKSELVREYLDVPLVHAAFVPHRHVLGVAEHPRSQLIFDKLLKRQPPLTPEVCREIFF